MTQELKLKELTKDCHTRAEKTSFMKRMLKKQISMKEYYVFLSNQFVMYSVLEARAARLGVFSGIEDIKRTERIMIDLAELERLGGFSAPESLVSTRKYVEYIDSIGTNPDKLLSHIYVRHMGDMSGGQFIKRLIPGSGRHYDFSTDVNILKDQLRTKLNNEMADEANHCFRMVIDFLEEIGSTEIE